MKGGDDFDTTFSFFRYIIDCDDETLQPRSPRETVGGRPLVGVHKKGTQFSKDSGW